MPVFTRPDQGQLIVSFARYGEPIENETVENGEAAWAMAVHLITKRHPQLLHGDFMFIRRDGDPEPELPEPSRASHMGG